MAKADNELDVYRRRLTGLLNEMNEIHDALAVVEGVGVDDTARVAFFSDFFTNSPDYDVTSGEFFASVVKLRELRDWLELPANLVALAKMRV